MWGSQGWNQWALQPSMFNDVPHEKIDWAELAKQWIQMQQTQPSDAVPPPQTAPPVNLPPPPGHTQLMPEEFPEHNINNPLLKTPMAPGLVPEPFHSERSFEHEPGAYIPKGGEVNFWNKPQWESSTDVDDRLWNPPAVEPVAPLIGGKETFDYGHMHDNPPLAMQTIDYNHMSDYSYNQVYPPPPVPVPPPPPVVSESHYDQYWSQVNAAPTIAPIFLKKERTTSNVQVEEETTHIDAAKRKQLPAWIRDGLEKMEQERLKRLEKERAAKEHAEQLSKSELLRKQLNLKPSAATILPKSKFESDSDGEQAEEVVTSKHNSPVLRKVSSPIEDTRTEEEKKQELMLKVRRTLTEILLSVTNSEMIAIAQEVYRKAKSRAPARQLASSTSMSSVASGLRGLASYDTESETSEADEGRKDVSDSEEELYRKIKEKKKLFAVKEKKIIAELERKELEDKTDKEKMNNGASEKNLDENIHSEQAGDAQKEQNSIEKTAASVLIQKFVSSNDIPFLNERTEAESDLGSNDKESNNADVKSAGKHIESVSSEDSSSSSDSDSSDRNQKKLHRDKSEKGKKATKHDKSPIKHSQHRKHNRNRDSDSSEKHRRGRSPDKSERKSSKKHKRNKRSDSSSSSSSASHRKKYSSKHSSSSYRERRSRSYEDRRHRVSVSPSRSHHHRDGHSHRSSHSHRYNDKYDKKNKEEKRYRDSKHSPSPYSHSSKLPKKYRRSRSLSSDYESSGKKSKKSRNR